MNLDLSHTLRRASMIPSIFADGMTLTHGQPLATADCRYHVIDELNVIDTGIGMTASQQERLFTPFSQADNSLTRRFGGTGLGLAISRRLAKLLGGDLAIVDSIAGQGTHFRLTAATGVPLTIILAQFRD